MFVAQAQRLGLLKRIKHILLFRACLLLYKSLVMLLFEYANLVWGDKHNITLMYSLQVLQNKAAKVILNRPLYSPPLRHLPLSSGCLWRKGDFKEGVYTCTNVSMA